MKVVVIKKYRDKITGKIQKKGSVIELDEKRYAEISKAGDYVKEVKEENPVNSEEQPAEKKGGRKGRE